MTALLLAALLGATAPSAPPPQPPSLSPAALVGLEAGAGLAAGALSMPAVYLVSLMFGVTGEVGSMHALTLALGILLLPPTAVAGTVWAVGWLDPTRAPRIQPILAWTGGAWAAVLVTGSVWHGSFWRFATLLTDGVFRTPGAALPWLLAASAVMTVTAGVSMNLTTLRRTGPGPWQRAVDEEPEDPFAKARPAPPRRPHDETTLVPLWAGRF